MNKIYFLLLIIVPLKTSIAGVLYVEDPGDNNDIAPKIQSIVNNAKTGDIIILPAGKFVFNGKITITNMRLSFIGQGIGENGTLLYRSEDVDDEILQNRNCLYFLSFNGEGLEDDQIIVSGIYFKSKRPAVTNNDGGSMAKDAGVQLKYIENFIVTNCRFENFGYAGVYVEHFDNLASGLIKNNVFFHNVKGYKAQGLGYGVVVYGANKVWVEDPMFGSNNFIFIEDNYFEEHRHSIAGGGAAKYVSRYNTIINNIWGHAIDSHESRGSELNTYSTRAVEIYDNSIINTKYANGKDIPSVVNIYDLSIDAIQIRGGEALIYNNYIEGFVRGISFTAYVHDYPEIYPIPYQIGYQSGIISGSTHSGTDKTSQKGDVFAWDNNFVVYEPNHPVNNTLYVNYNSDYIKEDRDYHLGAKQNYTPYSYPHPLGKNWEKLADDLNIQLFNYSVFPNPSDGRFTINNDDGLPRKFCVEIYDLSGRLIKKEYYENSISVNIDISDAPKGIYFTNIIVDGNKTTKKIVKF